MVHCVRCGVNKATNPGKGKGNPRFCGSCKRKPWQKFKREGCEFCGFVPVHPCQLDVDHKDGNKQNNTKENLQTLCANCHRLKTHLHKDYVA